MKCNIYKQDLEEIKKEKLTSKPSIDLISCESGDWEVLKFNGKIFAEGHYITRQN